MSLRIIFPYKWDLNAVQKKCSETYFVTEDGKCFITEWQHKISSTAIHPIHIKFE